MVLNIPKLSLISIHIHQLQSERIPSKLQVKQLASSFHLYSEESHHSSVKEGPRMLLLDKLWRSSSMLRGIPQQE